MPKRPKVVYVPVVVPDDKKPWWNSWSFWIVVFAFIAISAIAEVCHGTTSSDQLPGPTDYPSPSV